jgi:hypothetical protein
MPRTGSQIFWFYLNTTLTELESGVSGAGTIYTFGDDPAITCTLSETESGWAPVVYTVELTSTLTEAESGARMAGWMNVWYFPKPATMTADGDVCGMALELQGILVSMAEITARRKRGEDVRTLIEHTELQISRLTDVGLPARGRGPRLAPGIEPTSEAAD